MGQHLLHHLQSLAEDELSDLLHATAPDPLVKDDVLLDVSLEIIFIHGVV